MIRVEQIEANSLGERAGFLPGDRIQRINGQEIMDTIDFQVHSADASLLFDVERDGELYEVEVERQAGEGFGFTFEEMKLRSCNNQCVFCFIHQMPKGMRRSLYFEDDDYRLSFLHGSYVTLTNVKKRDIDRIIEQRLSPQYISVHATDPQLRQLMLGRRKPTGDIMERLRKLVVSGIEIHAQVVVCPGWNDGPHLERTVRDLSGFYPGVRSVALVPVGLTRFRQGLPSLAPVTAEKARTYIAQAETWGGEFQQTLGERFAYPADELFLLVGQSIPPAAYYDAFPQIENGIGMVRFFLDTWEQGKNRLPQSLPAPVTLGLVTGKLAGRFLPPIVSWLNRIDGLKVELLEVENDFFGRGITVSGLLSGADILQKIQRPGSWDGVLLPPNCINGEGLTIDDMTVPQLQDRAGAPLMVGQYDLVESLLDFIHGRKMAWRGSGRQLSELGYYVGRSR